jgi:hypothetical protein
MLSKSTDAGQEKRETFSYTTQISQMYHQLDSYHIGTNRALFFIHPRPHTIETEHTFVNGPRNIEGIQEFMFVVARPKDTGDICVEAYLETGHIGKIPIFQTETRQDIINLTVFENFDGKSGDELDRNNDDNTEDRSKEGQTLYSPPAGYKIVSVGPITRNVGRRVDDCKFTEQDESHAVLWGRVTAHFQDDFGDNQVYDAKLDASATVYLEAREPVAAGSKDTLFITGRKLCCCPREFRLEEGIVFEKSLDHSIFQLSRDRGQFANGKMPIEMANRLGQEIKEGIINSRTDVEHRYEHFIKLPQTTFANKALFNIIKDTHDQPLREAKNLSKELKDKLSLVKREVKVKDLLSMSLEMQKDIFSLNDSEVIELRNAITGFHHKKFDPREAWLSKRQIGKIFRKDDDTVR